MIIVIDSNIVFSAILNTDSLIGDLILNSHGIFTFRSCSFLTYEIQSHWKKIQNISKLSDEELQESRRLIYKNIEFIDERQIPKNCRMLGFELTKDVDTKDFVFVSLNEYIKSILWTGDKKLIQGLKKKGYQELINTKELVNLRLELEKGKKNNP